MIELPSLYDHQSSLRDRTRPALAQHRRVILTAPPGSGKTRLAKWIMGASANRTPGDNQSGKSLFAVHKRGLVENASNSFAEEPELPHGVIMSGVDTAWGHRTQVGSIDTLNSWFVGGDDGEVKYDTSVTFDLVVFDETHSHLSKLRKFLKYHDAYREELGLHPAYVIGLTATPEAKGLADVYRELVLGPPTQWLIDNGFLTPFRYVCGRKADLSKLVQGGDNFTEKSEAAAFEGMSGDIVRDWKRFAEGRPTVGFFPRRTHARDAMTLLSEAGVRVAYVDGETPDDTRARIYWELGNGHLDYLCNVQVVERGTDIPAIACVQLCVAVGSVVRYLQMIGRGSRIAPGKTDVLILDHGGNVARHAFFEDERHWSLDNSTERTGDVVARPTIECPECSAVYRGGKCRQCGYEPTPKQRAGQGLEFDGSELREIARKDKPQSAEKSPEELMIKALYSAGGSGRTWKQCVGIFFRANEKQGSKRRVPKTITVGGHRYQMLRSGDSRGGKRVSSMYPFTTTRGDHGGELYLGEF